MEKEILCGKPIFNFILLFFCSPALFLYKNVPKNLDDFCMENYLCHIQMKNKTFESFRNGM